jgi:hypothetical protein
MSPNVGKCNLLRKSFTNDSWGSQSCEPRECQHSRGSDAQFRNLLRHLVPITSQFLLFLMLGTWYLIPAGTWYQVPVTSYVGPPGGEQQKVITFPGLPDRHQGHHFSSEKPREICHQRLFQDLCLNWVSASPPLNCDWNTKTESCTLDICRNKCIRVCSQIFEKGGLNWICYSKIFPNTSPHPHPRAPGRRGGPWDAGGLDYLEVLVKRTWKQTPFFRDLRKKRKPAFQTCKLSICSKTYDFLRAGP